MVSKNLVNHQSIKSILQTPQWRTNKAEFDRRQRSRGLVNYDTSKTALKELK